MPKKPLPQFVPPMQASSVKEPFDSPGRIFEAKLDGYRAIAVIDPTGKARLWSRNHFPLEPKFPTIQDAVRQLKLCSTILDGKIVALDKKAYRGFSYCNNGKNARPLRLFYICSIYFGVMGMTLPGRRSGDEHDAGIDQPPS
jgi:bifunctional non-homologous end joining protein LigD